jgi:hypothetical protein
VPAHKLLRNVFDAAECGKLNEKLSTGSSTGMTGADWNTVSRKYIVSCNWHQNLLLCTTVGCSRVDICAAAGTRLPRRASSRPFAGGAFRLLATPHARPWTRPTSLSPSSPIGQLDACNTAGQGWRSAQRLPTHVFRGYASRKCFRRCVV